MWSGMGGKLDFYNARAEHFGEKRFFKDVLGIRRLVERIFDSPFFRKETPKRLKNHDCLAKKTYGPFQQK
jgi:hypothetical protein